MKGHILLLIHFFMFFFNKNTPKIWENTFLCLLLLAPPFRKCEYRSKICLPGWRPMGINPTSSQLTDPQLDDRPSHYNLMNLPHHFYFLEQAVPCNMMARIWANHTNCSVVCYKKQHKSPKLLPPFLIELQYISILKCSIYPSLGFYYWK